MNIEMLIVKTLRTALDSGEIVPSDDAEWGYDYTITGPSRSVETIAKQLCKDRKIQISEDWDFFFKVCLNFKNGKYDTKLHKALR